VTADVEYLVADLTGAAGPSVSVYVDLKTGARVVGVERNFAATAGE